MTYVNNPGRQAYISSSTDVIHKLIMHTATQWEVSIPNSSSKKYAKQINSQSLSRVKIYFFNYLITEWDYIQHKL